MGQRFFHGTLCPQKPQGLLGTGEEWDRECEPRPSPCSHSSSELLLDGSGSNDPSSMETTWRKSQSRKTSWLRLTSLLFTFPSTLPAGLQTCRRWQLNRRSGKPAGFNLLQPRHAVVGGALLPHPCVRLSPCGGREDLLVSL